MSNPTLTHLTAGAKRLPVVIAARALLRSGRTIRKAGRELRVPWQTLNKWVKRVEHITDDAAITAEALADQTFKNGRKAPLQFTDAEVAQVKCALLDTNLSEEAGSVPEALRRLIKTTDHGPRTTDQTLRPEVSEFIRTRLQTGQAPLTPAMMNQIRVSGLTTRAERAPRNAWLESIQSPGSLQMKWDDVTGQARMKQPGEELTIDDGTINFPCCVNIERPGDKCWDKFGVCVGRWQFILPGDTRSYFIPGFGHTARPRSSYRAEDLLATWQTVFLEHGVPPHVLMEKGISKATLIAKAMKNLGVKLSHANSPHQKVVEAIFNNLWTRLSGMPGQVGRFMGEEEQTNALLTSCRNGHTDPRQHFPMLADVLKALHEVITDWNSHTVVSRQYGSWVPREMFAKSTLLRPLAASDAWMFSPVVSPPLLVRKLDIRTTWNVMPGYSLQFNFSAPWFIDYYGARVELHYNPHRPECDAMVVLAEPFQGEAAGTPLGLAVQTNWHTRHNRRLLGIDEDEDRGLVQTRMNAQALRRSVVAIKTDGRTGAQTHEARNGVGEANVVERGTSNIQQPTSNIQRGDAAAELQAPRSRAAGTVPLTPQRAARKALEDFAEDALSGVTD